MLSKRSDHVMDIQFEVGRALGEIDSTKARLNDLISMFNEGISLDEVNTYIIVAGAALADVERAEAILRKT